MWQLSTEDEKSIPAVNILWDMADSTPYFVPTQFRELILFPLTVQKYGSDNNFGVIMKSFL
jgi:hypothetical protein